jgi:hypothetical protein
MQPGKNIAKTGSAGKKDKNAGVFCPNPGGAFYAMARLPVLMQTFSVNGCWKTFLITEKRSCSHGIRILWKPGLGLNEVRLAMCSIWNQLLQLWIYFRLP